MQTRAQPHRKLHPARSSASSSDQENSRGRAPNGVSSGIVGSLPGVKSCRRSFPNRPFSPHSTCVNAGDADDPFPSSFRAHHEETAGALRLPLGLGPPAARADGKKVGRAFLMHQRILGPFHLM